VIGWCRLREGSRVFRVDRFRHASLLNETAPARDFSEVASRVPDLVVQALELGRLLVMSPLSAA
jgi:predicted DNA-binding transcriptional regulator YafY